MVQLKTFMTPIEKIVRVDRAVSVRQAAKVMKNGDIGSIFVTRNEEIFGIVTDTDICRRSVGMHLDPERTPVETITRPLVKIDENKTIGEANALMAQEHVRHLGVSRNDVLVGMISVRDLVTFVSNLPRSLIMGSGGKYILEQIYGDQ